MPSHRCLGTSFFSACASACAEISRKISPYDGPTATGGDFGDDFSACASACAEISRKISPYDGPTATGGDFGDDLRDVDLRDGERASRPSSALPGCSSLPASPVSM